MLYIYIKHMWFTLATHFYLLDFDQHLSSLVTRRRTLHWPFTHLSDLKFAEVRSEKKYKTKMLFFMFKSNEAWNYFPQFNGAELAFNYAWVKFPSAARRRNKEREEKENRKKDTNGWRRKRYNLIWLVIIVVNYERTETPELVCVYRSCFTQSFNLFLFSFSVTECAGLFIQKLLLNFTNNYGK